LLRSLVVRAACRAEGLGTALHDRLLFYARLRGIERVYLLTTTAERFFRRLGWEPIARTAVPTGVRRTREFRELCPQTAVCLTRSLFEE
jgi:amino-acid N-acetyltransferase